MEDQNTLIGNLFDKTEQYAQTTADLYKLKAIDKAADVISTLAARFVIIIVMFVFFVIANIGLALWLGEILGRNFLGFFTVAGFYALLAAVCFMLRNQWIKEPIRSAIIAQALD